MARFRVIFLASLLLIAPFVHCEDEETPGEENDADDDDNDSTVKEDEGVLVLTTDNFDDVISDNKFILVEFYAPWCGHCKSLAPEYARAAKILKDSDPSIPIAKVDATVETDLASRFEVSGYPTLKFFKDGEASEYDGGRDTDSIVKFMKERADPNWKPPPEAVVTLTKEDFDDFVGNEELTLVEFYAPWCGHCKRLAPEYEKAAQALKNQDPPIKLAKVDATQETEIASKFEVSGYPTLKLFRKGRAMEYKGGRDVSGITNYMISQSGEASKLLASLKEVRGYMKPDTVTIIGFYDRLDDPKLRTYMDAANELRDDLKFGHTLLEDARKEYKVEPGSVVVFNAERFYTQFEPKWHVLKKDYQQDDVTEFVHKHKLPLVGHYNYDSQKFYNDKKPLCIVFYSVDWSFEYRKATQLWRQKVAAIAKDYPDLTFAVADEEEQSSLFEQFGLAESGEELNVGCFDKDGKRYPMEPMDEFDEDEIRDFLADFKKGKIQPHIKSQAVPKRQEGPVKVVVGKTFEEVVLDKKKDVLIEMYAPWCGHCKQLEPVYKDLAKKYKKEKNLVIAKLDATANDTPENYKAEGFPTIYYASAKNKDSPKKYDGGRTVDDFVKFLEQHATVSLGKGVKEEL